MKSTTYVAVVLVLALAACGGGAGGADGGGSNDYDAALPTGSFSLSWTLADANGTVTCEQVGAVSVRFDFVPNDGSVGFPAVFDCAAGSGTTTKQAVGSYTVSVSLKNSVGKVMASASPVTGQKIVAGAVTPVAPFAFTVSRTGGLDFRIQVPGASSSNCGPENAAGAALTGTRVELRTVLGACVPTAFAVAAGALGAQTLPAACPTTIVPCIERDQLLSATGIPAGTYLLALEGYEGGATAAACYTSTAQVTISGGDLVTNAGNVALPITSDQDAGCTPP